MPSSNRTLEATSISAVAKMCPLMGYELRSKLATS